MNFNGEMDRYTFMAVLSFILCSAFFIRQFLILPIACIAVSILVLFSKDETTKEIKIMEVLMILISLAEIVLSFMHLI